MIVPHVGCWRSVLVVVVVGSVGMLAAPTRAQIAGPLVTPAPFRTEDPSDRGVDANLYMQTSAEYRAACYQAYNLATTRLQPALAAARATNPAARPAVIMDLDETVFDNAGYQSTQIRKNLAFDQRSWDQWEEKYPDEVRLVPGAKDFIVAVEALGITVVHISNRREKYRAQARRALDRLGIPIQGDHQLRLSTDTTDKSKRRQDVERDYAVLLLIGDNLRDFDEQFKAATLKTKTPDAVEAAIQGRKARVDANRPLWGERWIIIPNPAYGEWTRPLGMGRADLDRLAPSMGGTSSPGEGAGEDDAAIRAIIQAYEAARGGEDPQAIAALLTTDADQLVSDGTRRSGRDELVGGMIESSRRNPARRTITVATVRLVSPEVALVDGDYRQVGGDGQPDRDMRTTFTLLRTPEGWKIAGIRNMLPATPAR